VKIKASRKKPEMRESKVRVKDTGRQEWELGPTNKRLKGQDEREKEGKKDRAIAVDQRPRGDIEVQEKNGEKKKKRKRWPNSKTQPDEKCPGWKRDELKKKRPLQGMEKKAAECDS